MKCKDWQIAYNEDLRDYRDLLIEAYLHADKSKIYHFEGVINYIWHKHLLEELSNGFRYED